MRFEFGIYRWEVGLHLFCYERSPINVDNCPGDWFIRVFTAWIITGYGTCEIGISTSGMPYIQIGNKALPWWRKRYDRLLLWFPRKRKGYDPLKPHWRDFPRPKTKESKV